MVQILYVRNTITILELSFVAAVVLFADSPLRFCHAFTAQTTPSTYTAKVVINHDHIKSSGLVVGRNNMWGKRISNAPFKSLQLYSSYNNDGDNETTIISKEAQELLARAKEIRESLKLDEREQRRQDEATTDSDFDSASKSGTTTSISPSAPVISPFNVPPLEAEERKCESVGYRLYLDIGREEGTWMDPRWGASGKRIECTIDITFLSSVGGDDSTSLASQDVINEMVKDNLSGKSTVVRIMNAAPKARLRNGFDQMKVNGGGYRIDIGGSSSNTVRFYLNADGTEGASSTYGDISIPKGNLYFSLPCFGSSVKQLSSKEGVVTVRQVGWHTGWRREESRIVGVFRAVPIDQAKKRDGF